MGRVIRLSLMYAALPRGARVRFSLGATGDPSRVARLAADLGYDGLELAAADPRSPEARAAVRAFEREGLEVAAVSTGLMYVLYGLSLSSPSREERLRALQMFEGYIDLAAEAGSRVVVVGLARGRCEGGCSQSMQRLRESLESLGPKCDETSVKLALEPINRYETDLVNRLGEAYEIASSMSHVGLLFDSFHAMLEERDPYEAILEYSSRIVHVHLADSNRRAPGMGIVDWERLIYRLFRGGYRGFATVEAIVEPSLEDMARTAASTLRPLIPG